MDALAYVTITLLVWAITAIRSPNLRATLYSLPIPMSIAIVSLRPEPASGNQLLGPFLLVVFFSSVLTLSRRLPNVVAVAVATLGYVAVTGAIERIVQIPWSIAYALAPLLALSGILITRSLRPDTVAGPTSTGRPDRVAPALLGSALATAVSFALGGWLGDFVVTFPYSGVAVALMWRDRRSEFCQRLALRSIGLYVFLGAYSGCSRSYSVGVSLALAWGGFLITTLLFWVGSQRARSGILARFNHG